MRSYPNGPSSGIQKISGERGQTIIRATPLDNASMYPTPGDRGEIALAGSTSNIGHTLKGASGVTDVGAASEVKHTIIKDH